MKFFFSNDAFNSRLYKMWVEWSTLYYVDDVKEKNCIKEEKDDKKSLY